MLSKDYNRACAAFSVVCHGEHGQLSSVILQGRHYYRKSLQPKCKRCRKIKARGYLMTGQDKCPTCGNPFIYTMRQRPGARFPTCVKAV